MSRLIVAQSGAMHEDADRIDLLTQTLIYEITKALALPQTKIVRAAIGLLVGKAARRFAALALELEHIVEREGPAAGARWLLPRFTRSHSACGVGNVPATGPLIIAANHPASIDSVLISAHVLRPDYKIIISDIPFFKNLPAVRRHAIFASPPADVHGRMQVVREVVRHLEQGGAILIFARGGIEPDPSFMPGGETEFGHWSRSLEVFLRKVPQTRVLVTIVSGVIAPQMMRHPLTRLRAARPDRQRLAFLLQMIRQTLSGHESYGLMPRVTFGEPLHIDRPHESGRTLALIHASAKQTLNMHLAGV